MEKNLAHTGYCITVILLKCHCTPFELMCGLFSPKTNGALFGCHHKTYNIQHSLTYWFRDFTARMLSLSFSLSFLSSSFVVVVHHCGTKYRILGGDCSVAGWWFEWTKFPKLDEYNCVYFWFYCIDSFVWRFDFAHFGTL